MPLRPVLVPLDPSEGLTPPGPAMVDFSPFLDNPPPAPSVPAATPPDHFDMVDPDGDGMITQEEMMILIEDPDIPATFNTAAEFLEFLGWEPYASGGGGGGFSVEDAVDVTYCFIGGGYREPICDF